MATSGLISHADGGLGSQVCPVGCMLGRRSHALTSEVRRLGAFRKVVAGRTFTQGHEHTEMTMNDNRLRRLTFVGRAPVAHTSEVR